MRPENLPSRVPGMGRPRDNPMTRLGVVTCQILELEFAHVLSRDPDVSETWVVDDPFSLELIRALERDGPGPVRRVTRVDEFGADADSGLAVLVRVMEVGLHAHIPTLKQALAAAVDAMAPTVDAVLLGYGLCGNALKDLDALFPDVAVPVILPMDNGEPVDDCVGLIIGGRENYYAEQCRCAGTMFMNAGFSRHWSKILSADVPEKLLHKKDAILDRLMADYKRSLLLPTPVLDEDGLRRNTREFSERHNLRTETRPGTLSLLENAWSRAKQAAGHPGRG